MKKFLIILLSIFGLVGIGYAAYTIYDGIESATVYEEPDIGNFEL